MPDNKENIFEKMVVVNWANSALSHLPPEKWVHLFNIALRVVANDGLKGDVSDAWSSMGYTTRDIPDMYR